MALLKVKNYFLLNMNKQHMTLLVLLDLSAAFDTVDRVILLRVLGSLSIGGAVIERYRSYLSGHGQRISGLWCTARLLPWTFAVLNLHQFSVEYYPRPHGKKSSIHRAENES